SPDLRTSVSRLASMCASWIGSGINSGVSLQAKPNINPWSPAPPVSTPIAISGDWLSIAERTLQVSQSKPYFARYHDQPGGHQCFTSNAGLLIFSEGCVQDGVRYLVCNFVRMAFGNRFR